MHAGCIQLITFILEKIMTVYLIVILFEKQTFFEHFSKQFEAKIHVSKNVKYSKKNRNS